ncbi:MAG: Gfo/Idh/MocA family oxidoreductase [Chloroflexota bacterium]|jgi:predicted dehydrogenase|nr:Gfo/Idh/MocA family oxidoreductase [Chloroflexota bacterium]
MKFLIAGLGSIGRRHLRNLLALDERDILLYRTHRSTLSDDELAPFPVETDLEAALAHQPDAVIVSNPTALHMAVAIPAAENGCHILLEKPIVGKMNQEVEVLSQAAAKNGARILVGFQFRYHPVLNQIHSLIQSGDLGRPYSFRAHWGEYLPGWHPWEDYRQGYAARKDLGGGVVNTLSHPLDYVRWLFGEGITLSAVTGQISDLELDVEDLAEIILKFKDGCVGSIHLDYFQRPPAHWLEVNCEKGHIHWDNDPGRAHVYRVDRDEWENLELPVDFERNDLFLAEMRHFLEVVAGKASPRVSLDDGVKALKLTEAVHRSAETGRRVQF